MNERRIGCGKRRSVEACSHQKPAQDEGDTGEDTALDPSCEGLRSKQIADRVESPEANPNGQKIGEVRGVSRLQGESHSHCAGTQRKQRIAHVISLWRDSCPDQHQSRHKRRAVCYGHCTDNGAPPDGRLPGRHAAQGKGFIETIAILRTGGKSGERNHRSIPLRASLGNCQNPKCPCRIAHLMAHHTT